MYILLILILSAANLQSAESGRKRVRNSHELSLIKRRMLDEATGRLELPVETDSDSDAEHLICPAEFLPICPNSHKDYAVKAPQVCLSLIMRDSFGPAALEHVHIPSEVQKICKWHTLDLRTLQPNYYNPLVHNCYPVSARKNRIAVALSNLALMSDADEAKAKANEIFAKNPKAISYRFEWTKTLADGQAIKKSTNPMLEAVRCGNLEFARFLINKGVPPCYSAENSRTPLHIAASKADVNMVKLLTDKEARLCLDTLKAGEGETPLDIAERKRQKYLHNIAVTARYDAIIAILKKTWAEQQAEEAFYAGDDSASEESEEDN